MTLAVQLRVYNVVDHRRFEHVTDRFPVLIGRDPKVSSCILEDDVKVSRMHAAVDLRGEELLARDAGSANGTFVNGQRLSDGWVSLGPANVEREIRIGNWVILAQRIAPRAVQPGQTSFGSQDGSMVANFNETMAADPADFIEMPPTGAQAGQRGTGAQYSPQIAESFRSLFDGYEVAARELYTQIARQLEALPPAARAPACQQISSMYPGLASNDAFAQLFRHYGATPIGGVNQTPETVALKAVRYLSQWYLGRPATTPAEIIAFCDKVRQAVDELLLGHVPLLAGLEKFEQQMALGDGEESFSLPHTPAEFSRALFDWSDPTDRASRALRRSFADLMVHQVGMLNGVMRGVKVLLLELAPSAIQDAWRTRQSRRSAVTRLFGNFRRASEMLSIYAKRHSDLADEENERFRLIFGREFVEEYKQFAREQSSETSRVTKLQSAVIDQRQLVAAPAGPDAAGPPAGYPPPAGPKAGHPPPAR